jgi:uncharacterized protein (UPF0248 family)
MVRLREDYLQYGEYYAVILFLMEDMIPYHKVDEVVEHEPSVVTVYFIRLSRRN